MVSLGSCFTENFFKFDYHKFQNDCNPFGLFLIYFDRELVTRIVRKKITLRNKIFFFTMSSGTVLNYSQPLNPDKIFFLSINELIDSTREK
jgi:hypothetical protein